MNNLDCNSTLNLEQLFPFQLDQFQKDAIAALDAGKSVVVCAPTGSGKTLIGEYAIYRALFRNKRVFYTTPLKALSNQKYRDFQTKFSTTSIGLITGDEVEYPEASVVVMTTEIFRNMLYETPIGQVGTSLENVESVVLDECHYISDRQRGTVWEESIIYCPPTIQLVALSATIGNPEELTNWINQARAAQATNRHLEAISECELINSDYRPVPLRYYFANREGLFPLLNNQQSKLNPRLKTKRQPGKVKKNKREKTPNLLQIIQELSQRELLPAIYLIFSRRGCDRAVAELAHLTLVNEVEAVQLKLKLLDFFLADSIELQEKLLASVATQPELHQKLRGWLAANPNANLELAQFLQTNPQLSDDLFAFLSTNSPAARTGQVEPLLRGIAAHHAGILPAWKKLVEELFEEGLVKVVFATATLAAGINMPARTTVISALSKRSDDGHRMLTPSEFFQIAGRAGRRGMDEVGYVVTVQTPFEGAKEAAYLATAAVEPLKSWFNPTYGMVLNLLQKHSLEEAKELLERSFAEYLAQSKLVPEQEKIAEITTELTKIDVELAPIEERYFASYEKLKESLKEELRLLEILQQQAEIARKKEIAPLVPQLKPGQIVGLKGKHIRLAHPLAAVFCGYVPSSGQLPYLLCLGADHFWYVAASADIADLNQASLPESLVEQLNLPELDNLRLGKWLQGKDDSAPVSSKILDRIIPSPLAPEVQEQQYRLDQVRQKLDKHLLQQWENRGQLIKRHKQRLQLREQLHKTQIKYQQHQLHKSYYWDDFLNLIGVLQELGALTEFTPTMLGKVAATIRSENEVWLGLAFMYGELEALSPSSKLVFSHISDHSTSKFSPNAQTSSKPRKSCSNQTGQATS